MSDKPSGWAIGWTTFAALMMMLIGFWHAMAGLVAILDDGFYGAAREYVFRFNTTTWGWIHLIVGIIVLLAGVGLFRSAVWARTIGVIMAAVSGLVGFAWLPYFPVWGVIFIAGAVAVIWALTAHGRDIDELTH
jgi:hypothetical protein